MSQTAGFCWNPVHNRNRVGKTTNVLFIGFCWVQPILILIGKPFKFSIKTHGTDTATAQSARTLPLSAEFDGTLPLTSRVDNSILAMLRTVGSIIWAT